MDHRMFPPRADQRLRPGVWELLFRVRSQRFEDTVMNCRTQASANSAAEDSFSPPPPVTHRVPRPACSGRTAGVRRPSCRPDGCPPLVGTEIREIGRGATDRRVGPEANTVAAGPHGCAPTFCGSTEDVSSAFSGMCGDSVRFERACGVSIPETASRNRCHSGGERRETLLRIGSIGEFLSSNPDGESSDTEEGSHTAGRNGYHTGGARRETLLRIGSIGEFLTSNPDGESSDTEEGSHTDGRNGRYNGGERKETLLRIGSIEEFLPSNPEEESSQTEGRDFDGSFRTATPVRNYDQAGSRNDDKNSAPVSSASSPAGAGHPGRFPAAVCRTPALRTRQTKEELPRLFDLCSVTYGIRNDIVLCDPVTRKEFPGMFTGVVGLKNMKDLIRNYLAKPAALPHLYVGMNLPLHFALTGPSGTGKRTLILRSCELLGVSAVVLNNKSWTRDLLADVLKFARANPPCLVYLDHYDEALYSAGPNQFTEEFNFYIFGSSIHKEWNMLWLAFGFESMDWRRNHLLNEAVNHRFAIYDTPDPKKLEKLADVIFSRVTGDRLGLRRCIGHKGLQNFFTSLGDDMTASNIDKRIRAALQFRQSREEMFSMRQRTDGNTLLPEAEDFEMYPSYM